MITKGVVETRKIAQELAKKYGERFAPPKMLTKMASTKERF